MSVLIVGGAGYIGSQTAKRAAAAGLEPVVFDNLVYGHRWAVKWGPLVEGDLADAELVGRVMREHRVRAVIHFAAYAYVGESVTNPRKYFRNNVVNTLNLLDAMLDNGVRDIVFSSTCAVYGEPRAVPIAEDHPRDPVNPYGESKLAVEKILQQLSRAYELRFAALRYFNAAGADPEGDVGEEHDPETHLIPLAIDAALGAGELKIFGTDYPTPDGTAIRDYIHVADLADAHLAALAHLGAGTKRLFLNLGTGRGHSVREVVAAVERGDGRKVPGREVGRRAGDPPALVADARQANLASCERYDLTACNRISPTLLFNPGTGNHREFLRNFQEHYALQSRTGERAAFRTNCKSVSPRNVPPVPRPSPCPTLPDPERLQARRDLRLENLSDVHFGQAQVPVGITLDVLEPLEVLQRHVQHDPFGDHRDAVAAPAGQPLDDARDQRVDDGPEADGRGELLGDERHRRARRLPHAERQVAGLPPHRDHEIPPRDVRLRRRPSGS